MTAPRTTKPDDEAGPKHTEGPLLKELPLASLRPSDFNPRTRFDQEALLELAASIKEQGVLEPILVRARLDLPLSDQGRIFEILAGERRFRAAQLAGIDTIPCLIRVADDNEARMIAVTENLQRKDLDPLDTARGYQILKAGGMPQDQIAAKLGVSPGEVSKSLVLLHTPDLVQDLLRRGQLAPSAARIIQMKFGKFPAFVEAFAQHVATTGMSMRELEEALGPKGRVPYSFTYKMPDTAARRVEWNTPFKAECGQCPHGALYGGDLCLMPTEFDRKMAEHRAKEEQEARTLAAKLKARGKALPMSGDSQSPQPEPTLPVLGKDLKYGQYEQLYGKAPAGCSEECECRCAALDGKRVVQICLDPKKLQRCKTAETKAQNKLAKEAGKARIRQILKLQHTDRESMGRSYAMALRALLATASTEARREALPMLPTASELDIVRSKYFATIRAAFDSNGTSGPWEQIQAKLAEAMGTITPIERNQVFLAAASAVGIYSTNKQIAEPRHYTAPEARFLLGEVEAIR